MTDQVRREALNVGDAPLTQKRVSRFRKMQANIDQGLLVLAFAALLIGWEWAAQTELISMLFFPPPSLILTKLIDGLADGSLLMHLATTLVRMFVGFLSGALPALLLGVVMSSSRRLNRVFDPIISAIHPLPKISILPLVILIVGVNEQSRIIIVALSAFFPMLVNTIAGINQIDHAFYDIAHTYNASRFDILYRLILPATLPFLMAGVRLGLNTSLTIAVSVELVFATTGLGTVVLGAWRTMRTESLYAALLLIGLVGIGINTTLNILSRWLIPWHTARSRERASEIEREKVVS